MNYRFIELPKKAFKVLLLAVVCGGFTACEEDYVLDDKGNYPSWLNSNIYYSLQHPESSGLTGTFTNYLKLIDEMGYKDVLSTTGSKTIFPANDEAFERFYQNNTWGVTRYEDLTLAMKKQLLYSSMLDNALLVEMFSNIPATNSTYSDVTQGIAMKHNSAANVVDTITHISDSTGMPQNNPFWKKYYQTGLDLVMDDTRPMMIHFTKTHLDANSITTVAQGGNKSDFEIITGSPYSDGMAYIFRNKIINPDVTCLNGYVQQLEDVLVPPGNVAEMLRQEAAKPNGRTKYFSRMLERFSAPFEDIDLTRSYNNLALQNGDPQLPMIYQKRYFSSRSQRSVALAVDPDRNAFDALLNFDPGWNTYEGSGGKHSLSDIAAVFVPTDEVFVDYFVNSDEGKNIIARYGILPNTEANLMTNIDQIDIKIVRDLLNNFMKQSFIASVPSKFNTVVKAGSGDPMEITVDDLAQSPDDPSKKDVLIANNGVIYMLNKMFPPDKFSAVSAPALFSTDMNIFRDAVNDGDVTDPRANALSLNLNFYAYLLAMKSNYALFIPDDEAFAQMYVDPVTLGNPNRRALKFYYNTNVENTTDPYVQCTTWPYNIATGEIITTGDSLANYRGNESYFPTSQLMDILNFHTIVLGDGETIGSNKYYKTKNGALVKIDLNEGTVASGAQLDNGRPISHIRPGKTTKAANGTTFIIDHLIEAPHNSVWKTLSQKEQFSEFMKLCEGTIDQDEYEGVTRASLLTFAGYSNRKVLGVSEQDKFIIFTTNNQMCYDWNVAFFSSNNYTVYAPDNDAMQKAYDAGLPTWNDVAEVAKNNDRQSAEKARAMCETINNFIRYHFQVNSVAIDNTVETGRFDSFCLNERGVPFRLTVDGGGGVVTVKDNSGNTITLRDVEGGLMANQMARDMLYNKNRASTSYEDMRLVTSSFSVIHEIDTPLNPTIVSAGHLSDGTEVTKDANGLYRYDYDIPQ